MSWSAGTAARRRASPAVVCGLPFARAEKARLIEEAKELLAFFGERLLPRADDLAYSLSYANRRRLEIARALATEPRLLLLDEPAAGMNPTETRELMADILRIRDRGITILLIEHDMTVVRGISDRVVALDHGVKIADGDFATVPQPSAGRRSLSRTPRRPCLSSTDVVTYYGPIMALKGMTLRSTRARSSACSAATRPASRRRMKTILGLVRPTAGTVEFEGRASTVFRTGKIVRRGIALVPEARRIFGRMTVWENLMMGAYARSGEPQRRDRRRHGARLRSLPAPARAGQPSMPERSRAASSRCWRSAGP